MRECLHVHVFGKAMHAGMEREPAGSSHIRLQQRTPDLAQGALDVLRRQLPVLAHAVPGLLQTLAQAVEHGRAQLQAATPLRATGLVSCTLVRSMSCDLRQC